MKRLKRRDFIKTTGMEGTRPAYDFNGIVAGEYGEATGQPRSAGSRASLDRPGGQRDLRAWEALGVLLAGDMVR
jgi:hypothetical protein